MNLLTSPLAWSEHRDLRLEQHIVTIYLLACDEHDLRDQIQYRDAGAGTGLRRLNVQKIVSKTQTNTRFFLSITWTLAIYFLYKYYNDNIMHDVIGMGWYSHNDLRLKPAKLPQIN